ncbi:ribosome-recycling factor [Aspergillus saccharolyticus JOP 1030-1]|uniref:Putative ribosome recycling factor n=1 Tax=Aspergillus saccharolyticus JOP 1030-1 TaxID=1450539 RepID=A0A319A3I8_9EURO|nr:putative ribosome recycling factor [Aspergillus saccharolyticus JOP 1030-1]PYH46698.1 putative ribosome recycling factor [Aspergillus saccharolyticus JOP 1030-1]
MFRAVRLISATSKVSSTRCLGQITLIHSFVDSRRSSQRILEGLPHHRRFSISPALHKKKEKSKSHRSVQDEERELGSSLASSDPYDLSQLHNGISAALSSLKDDLSKLRGGGRFDIGSIEALRVQLSKASKETLRLGDLAQVIPKGGRMVTVLAAEEEHIKPIISAVVSSNLSLTPQADPHNTLQLNVPIPPPTKESRDQAVTMAKKAMERAAAAVRDSRGVVHRRLQDMQRKKAARPDDVRKAQEQMEKVSEKGQKDVKELFETAKKAMERA